MDALQTSETHNRDGKQDYKNKIQTNDHTFPPIEQAHEVDSFYNILGSIASTILNIFTPADNNAAEEMSEHEFEADNKCPTALEIKTTKFITHSHIKPIYIEKISKFNSLLTLRSH